MSEVEIFNVIWQALKDILLLALISIITYGIGYYNGHKEGIKEKTVDSDDIDIFDNDGMF